MGIGAGQQSFKPIIHRKRVRIEQCDELCVALSQCKVISCSEAYINIGRVDGNPVMRSYSRYRIIPAGIVYYEDVIWPHGLFFYKLHALSK
jgi:hypothetical protein